MSLSEFPDQADRLAALNPQASFIVQAPAGSGKTYLLTQRFLKLLAWVERAPEECLAITFTRKAAAEMSARVLQALQQAQQWQHWREREPNAAIAYITELQQTAAGEALTLELALAVLQLDRQRGWNLLTNPTRLKIQTIDSLCSSIVKQMPILAQLGAQPNISKQPFYLYQKAVRNCFLQASQAPWRSAWLVILEFFHNDTQYLESLLLRLLPQREQWLPHILAAQRAGQQLKPFLESGLTILLQEYLAKLQAKLPKTWLAENLDLLNYAYQHLQPASLVQKYKIGALEADLFFGAAGLEVAVLAWQFVVELIFTSNGQIRKNLTKQQGFPAGASGTKPKQLWLAKLQQWRDACEVGSEYADEAGAVILSASEAELWLPLIWSAKQLPPLHYPEAEGRLLVALAELLPNLIAELMLVFKQQATVDFTEVALAALRALGTDEEEAPTELSLALDYKLRHILVDEFQDTSVLQFQLLEALTRGWAEENAAAEFSKQPQRRTVFLVGDPMQSIYRFRQAEVGLFLQAQQYGLNGLSLESICLQTNFRSTATVVNWINKLFAQVFPKAADISLGAIPYTESVAAAAAEAAADAADADIASETVATVAETTVNWLSCPDDAAQYQAVVALIMELQQQYPEDSLAILVRSRSQLQHLLPVLRSQGIKYTGIEIESLLQSKVVRDILALLKVLLQSQDRLAWLGLLRTPLLAFSLRDLSCLTMLQPGLERQAVDFWAWLQQVVVDPVFRAELSEVAWANLARLVPVLQNAWQWLGRHDIVTVLRWCWRRLGGELALTKQQHQDLQLFYRILTKVEQLTGSIDLNLLLDYLGQEYSSVEEANANNTSADNFKQDLAEVPLPEQAIAPVQVMTIHKAKGLEFDTVIIPALDKSPQLNQDPLFLWEQRASDWHGEYLLLAPQMNGEQFNLFAYLKNSQRARDSYEMARLFYVAATRSKKRLYGLATIAGSARASSFASLVLPSWWLEAASTGTSNPEAVASLETASKPEAVASPGTVSNPEVVASSSGTVYSLDPEIWQHERVLAGFAALPALAEPEFEFNFKGGLAIDWERCVGLVVHRFFCLLTMQPALRVRVLQIINSALEPTDLGAGAAKPADLGAGAARSTDLGAGAEAIWLRFVAVWQEELIAFGLTAAQAAQAVPYVSLAIKRACQDPVGRWLLTAEHQDSRAEWQLVTAKQRVVIDRAFIAPDALGMLTTPGSNLRWLIDYKVVVQAPDFAELKAQYQKQLTNYEWLIKRYDQQQGYHYEGLVKALYLPLQQQLLVY